MARIAIVVLALLVGALMAGQITYIPPPYVSTPSTQSLSATDQINCGSTVSRNLIILVEGDGDQTTLTSDPPILAGVSGQRCTLVANDVTRPLTLTEGSSLDIGGSGQDAITIGELPTTFIYLNSAWRLEGSSTDQVQVSNITLDQARQNGSIITCPNCGAFPPEGVLSICPSGSVSAGCIQACYDPVVGACVFKAIAGDGDVQMKNARFRGVSAAAPADPMAGDWYIDTTTSSHICIYNGSGWDSTDASGCS